MDVNTIENLQDVLQNVGPNKKIVDYKLSRLTAPGENYGSLMLRLEVNVKDTKTGEEKKLELVAKLLPPNELLRKVFNVQVTYRNEAALYNVIVPTLEEFQREQGVENPVDFFAKYYGSRLNLNPKSNVVDDDAVLILENLKVQGYTTINRRVGFDFDCAKMLVKNLAYFHAIPLALKLNKPDVFEKNIKPYLVDFTFGDEGTDHIVETYQNILKENRACVPYLEITERLVRQKSIKTFREPFASIIHNDYWVNNMMLKFENNKPTGNKMLDFQVIEYKCPCRDLLFFLFSSVQLKVLKDNLDYFIDLYYKSFIGKLDELKANSSLFTRDLFDKELELAMVESEFFHLTFMLFPIYADASGMKELSELSTDDFKEKSDTKISEDLKEKLWYLVLESAKRGWLREL